MKRFWLAIFAVAVLATAAQAGTVRYEIEGDIFTRDSDGNKVASSLDFSGWMEFATPLDTYYTAPGLWSSLSPSGSRFITWELEVFDSSTTYVDHTSTGTPWDHDMLYAQDDTDGFVQVLSAEDSDTSLLILLQDGATDFIDGNGKYRAYKPVEDQTWDSQEMKYVDGSTVYEGNITSITTVVPLPGAAWAGLGLLGALGLLRKLRRRK